MISVLQGIHAFCIFGHDNDPHVYYITFERYYRYKENFPLLPNLGTLFAHESEGFMVMVIYMGSSSVDIIPVQLASMAPKEMS